MERLRGTCISIHASAREATEKYVSLRPSSKISIHASARGATIKLFLGGMSYRFQSTPPRGRRRQWARRDFMKQYFNPRLREGGDVIRGYCEGDRMRFQSTPPRGRRLRLPTEKEIFGEFQSTPPRGRRQLITVSAPSS